MKIRNVTYLIVGALLALHSASSAYAGLRPSSITFGAPAPQKSLLDLSRIDIKTGMVFGFSSVGGRSQSAGALHTTLGYTASPRLRLQATLSKEFAFHGLDGSSQGVTLSGLQLDWRPVDSMHLHIEFNRYPSMHSLWSDRHNPWKINSW